METKITKQGNNHRVIEVEVSKDELDPHFDSVYRKYQKNIRLEGFRKGKVPLGLIKRLYGEEIQSEAIDEVVQNIYKEVTVKENLKPIVPAKLEDVNYEPEKGLHFKFVVEVVPDIELKFYKGVSVEREIYEVGDEDVAAALEELREQMAVMNPVEEEAKENSYILADFQEIDSTGVPVIGKKYENRFFQLNSNEFTKEFSDQLIGAKPGETRRIKITTLQENDPQNQNIEYYNVKVKEVKEKELPELDDELARDVGKYDNLEALKADIKKNLIKKSAVDSKQQLHKAIINEILKNNSFDLPESMIKHYLDAIIKKAKKEGKEKIDENMVRENYRPMAIWELKWHLIKEKIAEIEKIEVSEEDKRKYISQISEERGIDEKQLWKSFQNKEAQKHLKEDVLENKVLNFLENHAKIKERRVSRSDLEKAKNLAVVS